MSDTPPISPKKSSSSPKHDAGSITVTTDPTLNPSSPYFILPSEGPSSVSITPVLDGTNIPGPKLFVWLLFLRTKWLSY